MANVRIPRARRVLQDSPMKKFQPQRKSRLLIGNHCHNNYCNQKRLYTPVVITFMTIRNDNRYYYIRTTG